MIAITGRLIRHGRLRSRRTPDLPTACITEILARLRDLPGPRQQLLSGRPAGGRRPGAIHVCQNPGHRSHEPTANTVVTGKSRTPPGVSQPSATQDSAATVTGFAKTYGKLTNMMSL